MRLRRQFSFSAGLFLLVAPVFSQTTLWYSGDSTGPSTYSNGFDYQPDPQVAVFQDFVVPAQVSGWAIGSVFANAYFPPNSVPTRAQWYIQFTQPGNLTEPTMGVTDAENITPIATGRTASSGSVTLTEYKLQIPVSRFSVRLPPGHYWLAVVPFAPTQTGDPSPFASQTSGANCVGTPCGNSGEPIYQQTSDSQLMYSAVSGGVNFSMGVMGAVAASPVPAVFCFVNAAVPPVVRAEGIAEWIGDLTMNCQGGTPTPSGQSIPLSTIQLNLNAPVTSRVLPNGMSDATLMIDEPNAGSAAIPNTQTPLPGSQPQRGCDSTAPCPETGTGGSPSPYQTQPDVFLGRVSGNTVTWSNVPIDPPAPFETRVIRMTNIRANVSTLNVSQTFVPTAVTASVVAPTLNLFALPQQTIAVTQLGSVSSVTDAFFSECSASHNASLIGGSGTPTFDFNTSVTEGFPSAFRRRDIGLTANGVTAPALFAQNVPGFAYNTETDFYAPALFSDTPTPGLANFGTRFLVTFTNVPSGVHLFVPVSVALTAAGSANLSTPPEPPSPVPAGITAGQLQMVQADQFGNSPLPGYTSIAAITTIQGTPVAEVNYSGNTAYVTYEVVNSDPTMPESATIPVAVAFNSSQVAVPSGQDAISVTISEAPAGGPLAGLETGDPTAPIPRFVISSTPSLAFWINSCLPPEPTSVAPNSGSGSSQGFDFTFSDPNGSNQIVYSQLEISDTLRQSGTCYMYYSLPSNKVYLADDTGAFSLAALTPGLPGIAQNSQCQLNSGLSGIAASGNVLDLSLSLVFKPGFAGNKKIFAEAHSATGQDSGWVNMGNWTVTSSGPDFSLGISPGSRSVSPGGTTSYTVTVNAINGFNGVVNFEVSALPSGASAGFTPTSVTGSGSATATVNTASNVAVGNSTFAVTGISGALEHNASAALNVTAASASGPPAPTSVSPTGSSGASQIFAFTFTDPNGATDIVSTQMDINAQLSATNACYFYYARASNGIYLADNAGAWQGPVTPGNVGTLSNSQCSLVASASSVSASGSTLTLNLAISFQTAFAGAKGIFMEVQNATQDSGWSKLGSWTVTTASAPPPDFSLGVTPGSDSIAPGASANYTVTVTAVNGFSGVVSFNASGLPSGATASFNPTTVTGSGSTTLTVNTSSSGGTGSFTIGVTGTSGALSHNTSASLGISGSANTPPEPVSVSPNSSSGSSQTFAFTFTDPNGATDIVATQMDINAQLSATNACYFYYSRASNGLYLANNAGAWQGPVTVGGSGTLSNSQCTVNAGASSVSASGTTLTLNLAVSFQAAFAGAKGIFMEVQNASQDSGWSKLGTWTATSGGSNGPPAAVSVSPNTGMGSSQTFAFTFTDPNGATDIESTQLDINAQLAAANACYFYYARASNALYLANNAGAWQGPVTVGGTGTLSNSQCSVNAATSSVSASGTTLTLNLAISFEAGFAGAKNIFMEVQNATVDSGWSKLGAWTVP